MIVRGILQAVTDGAVRLFSATGRPGETFSLREFLQHYGFASYPKAGAELVIAIEGNVITAIGSDDRRYRLALVEGEAALYDDLGQVVHLTRDGIVVKSDKAVTVEAREVNLGSDRAGLLALIDERILELLNAHTHTMVQAGKDASGPMVVPIIAEMVCTTIVKAG